MRPFLLFTCLILPRICGAQTPDTFQEALKKSDFYKAGHFRLEANATYTGFSKQWNGTYILEYLDDNNWRELVSLGPLQELRVAENGNIAISRTEEIAHPAILGIRSLLTWPTRLSVDPAVYFVKKSKVETVRGTRATCYEVVFRANKNSVQHSCIDMASGLFIGDSDDWLQISDYRPFGNYSVPYSIKTKDREVRVTSIQPLDALTLKKAQSNKEMRGCFSPAGPWLAKKVTPDYPQAARSARMQGSIELYAVINESGDISELKPFQDTSVFTAAASTAVQRWKYHPAICDGQPVPTETTITVNFNMNPY